MQGLTNLDQALFRWINGDLSNAWLDQVMPWFSYNAFFFPAVLLIGILLLSRGGKRGAVFVGLLILVIAIGDGFIVRSLKELFDRARPGMVVEGVHKLVNNATNRSMPSAHAANWFSAMFVAFIYYRRSIWFMLPMALLVAFSRIYNGVHFPSDVAAGALLGMGYAAAIAWSVRHLWAWAGQKWFPSWWEAMPDLFSPPGKASASLDSEEEDLPMRPPPGFRLPSKAATLAARHLDADRQWLHLGYVVIAVLLVARLFYVARPAIELSEDEAYQWVWSKHPALSYYSKPPLIAYTQMAGTAIWGDTELGVRFFSPVIAAILGFIVLRFFAREVNARAGFFLLLICTSTPLLAAGSVLMTIDPLSALFWTAAALAGWRAVQDSSTWRDWLWVGVWMGMGFLSKYVQLLQLVCWVVFFIMWPPARKQLRRAGPYLALAINAIATLPVVIWNAQHQWITAKHVAGNAAIDEPWSPSFRYIGEFLGAEFGLLNPVFFIATVWAAVKFWRLGRKNPRLVYFFSMGAPLFVIYTLYTIHSRVLPNWIAPSVVPLFCFMVIYWDTQWRLGAERLKPWLTGGLAFGLATVLICHETDLVKAITGFQLPASLDPLRRVRGWQQTAKVAGEARERLMEEGKPVFVIGSHYGITGLTTFYLPEARNVVKGDPIIFALSHPVPKSQFHLWPGYESRKGQNAIFIRELNLRTRARRPLPPQLEQEFESVTDLGVTEIQRKRKTIRVVEMYACRGLR